MDVSTDPGVRVLLGVESQPRAAGSVPGEVFLQGKTRGFTMLCRPGVFMQAASAQLGGRGLGMAFERM